MNWKARKDGFSSDGVDGSKVFRGLVWRGKRSPTGVGLGFLSLEHFLIVLFRVVSHMGRLKATTTQDLVDDSPALVFWGMRVFGVVV